MIAGGVAALLSACSVGSSIGTGDSGGAFLPDAGRGEADGGRGAVDAANPDAGPPPPGCLWEEVCGDGLDSDCDNLVEEGCPCEPGETTACFRGRAAQRNQGICRDGTMLCEGSFEFGVWGECQDDIGSEAEVCDPAGLDEDCDGAANEGCECVEGDGEIPCGSDVGECSAGTQSCEEGVLTECVGATEPDIEACDGLDNDCDGMVDEGLSRGCGISGGVCRTGTQRCSAGEWGVCEGSVDPGEEVCDSLDNDCDGTVDEAVTRSCGSGTGECVSGTETCTSGSFGECVGAVGPGDESCNGRDDDCDGRTDEDLTRSCGTDEGRCRAGTQTCSAGGWGSCSGSIEPIGEACEGSVDEDCDGTVDEGCTCTNGATRPCGTDTGECRAGMQTCSSGTWGSCAGDIGPSEELCDGRNNDCDAETDEGCDCITGATRSCGTTAVGECRFGTETCNAMGRWGACIGAVGPVDEVCNDRDDDCDTDIDEDDVCPRFPPNVTCPSDRTTEVGTAVSLSGGGSDPDGGPVTFAWTVVARPSGSSASPSPANAATTSFNPDRAGDYTLRLCVTDDEGESRCCTADVTAELACVPPAAPTIDACPVSWDRRPLVEFDAVPSGIFYELYQDGVSSPYGTVTLVGQNYHRPTSPIASGGAPPGSTPIVEAELSVRACRSSDPSCCSTSDEVTVRLIEECSTPVAPSSSNIVFSEYVVNGDGSCPGGDCEAGEAIEITNLSHCPVALDGYHFSYCNPNTCGAYRWMDFGASDIIPPRGVYVAIRNRSASDCDYPFFGANDPSLFGLRISSLDMNGDSLISGWFNNGGGGMSRMRVASGNFVDISSGTTLELVAPYLGTAGECESVGFDAIDECGQVSSVSTPTDVLAPNQLGRLWHPCDAVESPVPSDCE